MSAATRVTERPGLPDLNLGIARLRDALIEYYSLCGNGQRQSERTGGVGGDMKEGVIKPMGFPGPSRQGPGLVWGNPVKWDAGRRMESSAMKRA
jgi:hypothetical protein